MAPRPQLSQLRTLFVSSAIPMIGFGFMDNFIMIQAGGYIDSTIGVKFGLATMTAAAMGQVVSDVSGVVFGGTLERFLHRAKIIQPSNLSTAQRHLPLCRNIAMAGAVIGVAFGCMLGATSLMFIDLDSNERHKRAAELQRIITSMLKDDGDKDIVGYEACTLYLVDDANHHPSITPDTSREAHVVSLRTVSPNSHAARCARDGVLMIDNHADKGGETFGETTKSKSLLCAPVRDSTGDVLAVIEFRNKRSDTEKRSGFDKADEQSAKMLAHHIGIFMDHIE